jgi:hypothetical protein
MDKIGRPALVHVVGLAGRCAHEDTGGDPLPRSGCCSSWEGFRQPSRLGPRISCCHAPSPFSLCWIHHIESRISLRRCGRLTLCVGNAASICNGGCAL